MNPITSLNLRNALSIAIIFSVFAMLFGTTIVKLVHEWSTNDNYSHGFLVPVIVGYMIWQKKDQLAKLVAKPSNIGLMVIIFGMCAHIVGNIGAELFTMRIAIVITTIGLCIYAFGIRISYTIAVPLAYLMFMVPLPTIIWNKISFPLQLMAAQQTSNVVHLLGIPMLREGNVLQLPNTTLEVVDACSGLRSLTSLLALSAAFSFLSKLKIIGKWILFLSALPVAIIVNIVRLTSTAMLAIYMGPEAAQGFLHDLSGIIVFIVAFIMILGIYNVISIFEAKLSKQFASS